MKYLIKVESMNPEFPLDETFTNGFENDGFLIIPFNEKDKPIGVFGVDVSTLMLAQAIGADTNLRCASAIAEGFVKAKEITKEDVSRKLHTEGLSSILSRIMEEEDDE